MQKETFQSEMNSSVLSSKIGVTNNSFIDEGDTSETSYCGDDENKQEPNSPEMDKNVDENKRNDTNNKTQNPADLLYTLNETPPLYTTVFCSFQVCLFAIHVFAYPIHMAPRLCVPSDEEGNVARANLVGTIFFVVGVTTILQTVLGVRLPILQGISAAHLPPMLALLALPHNRCPPPLPKGFMNSSVTLYNDTDGSIVDGTELWQRRMREVQGAVALSSVLEVLIGAFGLVGYLLKFVGPVTVVPTILLSVLPLTSTASRFAHGQWGIALLVFATISIFSQYLVNVSVPLPYYNWKRRSWRMTRVPIFAMFSILMTLIGSYALCAILTYTDSIPNEPSHHAYKVRTDIRVSVIESSPWFRFPYPGQWGLPKLSVAGFTAMLSAIVTSIIDSIGDYYASARASGAPPPPAHAINRGILIEGISAILAGVIGNVAGSTSFLTGVAAINVTRIGSRAALIGAGIIFTFFGLIPKVGSLFVSIPDPIVGGLIMVAFSTVCGVAFQYLSHVNLNSKRNVFIIGSSIFLSLTITQWSGDNQGAVQTGSSTFDQVVTVLLQSSVFIGSSLAILFDNTIPGTRKERGIDAWIGLGNEPTTVKFTTKDYEESYDLPFPTKCLGFFNKHIPVLPGYKSPAEKSQMKARTTSTENKSIKLENIL